MTCYDYVMLAAAVMIAVETGKDDIKDRTMLCMKRLSTRHEELRKTGEAHPHLFLSLSWCITDARRREPREYQKGDLKRADKYLNVSSSGKNLMAY